MNYPQVTVYGYGYVGKALVDFLKSHYRLQVVDPLFNAGNLPDMPGVFCQNPSQAQKTKYAVVCVPTKMNDDGTCDTSIVEDILKNTNHDFYLIKSTVIPGTTKKLTELTGKKIAFSPEYIGEGKYEIPFWLNFPHPTNMKLHSFHIFGGPKEVASEFVNLWQKVAGWSATYQQTDSTTAELVKYMENAFLATKKIFCDELYEIAKAFGVNYNELKELWLLDGRIGRAMTLIFPDSRGFGGKCLPKDVNAIVKAVEAVGYNSELLKQVLASNKKFQALNMSEGTEDLKPGSEAGAEGAGEAAGAENAGEGSGEGQANTGEGSDAGASTDASAGEGEGTGEGETVSE